MERLSEQRARVDELPAHWPHCPEHPGAPIRRYRMRGPHGVGVYLQCLPANGEEIHLVTQPTPARAGVRRVHLQLTDAEREILADAAAGLTITASAAARGKGFQTVKSLRRRITVKLDARTMTHAISVAVQDGLIERPSRPGGEPQQSVR